MHSEPVVEQARDSERQGSNQNRGSGYQEVVNLYIQK